MKSFSRWNGVELVSLPKGYYGLGVFGQKLAYLFFLVLGQTTWLQFCGIIFLPWSHWLLGSRVTDGRLCPTICHWDHLQGRGQRHCKGPGDIEHLGNCLGLAMQLLPAGKSGKFLRPEYSGWNWGGDKIQSRRQTKIWGCWDVWSRFLSSRTWK